MKKSFLALGSEIVKRNKIYKSVQTYSRGFKISFMLSLAQHEISLGIKNKNTNYKKTF